jgi:hypothetical protein
VNKTKPKKTKSLAEKNAGYDGTGRATKTNATKAKKNKPKDINQKSL